MIDRPELLPGDPLTLLGRASVGDGIERASATVGPRRVVGGWATVELDRAERETRAALAALGEPEVEVAPDDELLGARCRRLRYPGGYDLLLLEPSTEGRLAASLARFGEGTVAVYLVAGGDAAARVRAAGFAVSGPRPGPLGLQRSIDVGGRWGPHLLLVEEPAATIHP